MVTLDRIRLTGLLQESPANAGLSHFLEDLLQGNLTMFTGMGRSPLRCGTGVVDHVVDGSNAAQRDGEQVVQLDAGGDGDLEAVGGVDRGVGSGPSR
jgi:hypothetical protein